MSWNPQMEFHYSNSAMPYNSIGSFMDFFGAMTYDHVNYIFADASYAPESLYPSVYTNQYKFGFSEAGNFCYYDYSHDHVLNNQVSGNEVQDRHLENPSTIAVSESVAADMHQQENLGANSMECPRGHHNTRVNEVVWQDNIDPDNMTYEELLELGEAVGTQSRGLSQDLISLLPVTKFKRGLFSRRKSRTERCVICQMEYKKGDRQITLPCKHAYHKACGSRWLSINKACPICYSDVVIKAPKQ
nr:E3 ubiquitin ligase BIG BROTHER-like [Ipomoea batatas]